MGVAERRHHPLALGPGGPRTVVVATGGDAAAGPGHQLPARRRRAAQDLGDPLIRHLESVPQHQRHPFRRRQLLQHQQHRGAHRLIQQHRLGGSGPVSSGSGSQGPTYPPGPGGGRQVIGSSRRRRGQPGAQVPHMRQVGAHGAQPHLLDDVLGVGDAAEDPVGRAEHRGAVPAPLPGEPIRHGRRTGRPTSGTTSSARPRPGPGPPAGRRCKTARPPASACSG